MSKDVTIWDLSQRPKNRDAVTVYIACDESGPSGSLACLSMNGQVSTQSVETSKYIFRFGFEFLRDKKEVWWMGARQRRDVDQITLFSGKLIFFFCLLNRLSLSMVCKPLPLEWRIYHSTCLNCMQLSLSTAEIKSLSGLRTQWNWLEVELGKEQGQLRSGFMAFPWVYCSWF